MWQVGSFSQTCWRLPVAVEEGMQTRATAHWCHLGAEFSQDHVRCCAEQLLHFLPLLTYFATFLARYHYYFYGDCRGSVRGVHQIAVLFITCFDFRASVRLTCKIIGKKILLAFLFRHWRKMFARNNNMTLVLLFTQDIPKYFNKNIFFSKLPQWLLL